MENDIVTLTSSIEIHPSGSSFAVVRNGAVYGTYESMSDAREVAEGIIPTQRYEAGDANNRERALVAKGDDIAHCDRVFDAASDDGWIQAAQMVALFPSQPKLHTATRMYDALLEAGAVEVD